jgi:hypothetical protein
MRVDPPQARLRFVRPPFAATANLNANLSDSPSSAAGSSFACRRIAGLIFPVFPVKPRLPQPTRVTSSARLFGHDAQTRARRQLCRIAALGAGDAQVPNGANVVPPKLKSFDLEKGCCTRLR